MFFLYFVLHREHQWWIASAKLNPPEGHCIFGIWSIYCYDCQFMSLWFVFLFVAILVTLFLELLIYIENIIVGLLTRSWIRPKAFMFLAYDQCIVMTANDQFIVMIIMICDFICCNSCDFVSWIAYVHREHHCWIAYAKLNPPEGLCIFGIWSIYCYDCPFMSL